MYDIERALEMIIFDLMTYDLDGSLISDKNTSVISTDCQPITNRASNDSFIFDFKSKGLHVCNLNIKHILPKIDEIRLILLPTGSPDIFGICESFLGTHHPDSLITVDGYNFFRKDRSETQQKSGDGLVLYFRQSLNVKRRYDLEIPILKLFGYRYVFRIASHFFCVRSIDHLVHAPSGSTYSKMSPQLHRRRV